MPATSATAIPTLQMIRFGKYQQAVFVYIKINPLPQATCVFYTVREYQFLVGVM